MVVNGKETTIRVKSEDCGRHDCPTSIDYRPKSNWDVRTHPTKTRCPRWHNTCNSVVTNYAISRRKCQEITFLPIRRVETRVFLLDRGKWKGIRSTLGMKRQYGESLGRGTAALFRDWQFAYKYRKHILWSPLFGRTVKFSVPTQNGFQINLIFRFATKAMQFCRRKVHEQIEARFRPCRVSEISSICLLFSGCA
jgi:hypothetical protein